MADIAAVFHWVPTYMDTLELDELMHWHMLAIDRYTQMNRGNT